MALAGMHLADEPECTETSLAATPQGHATTPPGLEPDSANTIEALTKEGFSGRNRVSVGGRDLTQEEQDSSGESLSNGVFQVAGSGPRLAGDARLEEPMASFPDLDARHARSTNEKTRGRRRSVSPGATRLTRKPVCTRREKVANAVAR